MLRSRALNNHINNTHENALRLTYKDNQSSFKKLLAEVIKPKNDIATNIINDVFGLKQPPYYLKSKSDRFTCQNFKTTY